MPIQDNRPIYLQIADGLMDDILRGVYSPDSRVPSVRETAMRQQVNVNTAMRAYEQLERDGIVYNRRGLGFYVTAEAVRRILDHRKREFFDSEIDYMFGRLRSLDMTPEELAGRYREYLER